MYTSHNSVESFIETSMTSISSSETSRYVSSSEATPNFNIVLAGTQLTNVRMMHVYLIVANYLHFTYNPLTKTLRSFYITYRYNVTTIRMNPVIPFLKIG